MSNVELTFLRNGYLCGGVPGVPSMAPCDVTEPTVVTFDEVVKDVLEEPPEQLKSSR